MEAYLAAAKRRSLSRFTYLRGPSGAQKRGLCLRRSVWVVVDPNTLCRATMRIHPAVCTGNTCTPTTRTASSPGWKAHTHKIKAHELYTINMCHNDPKHQHCNQHGQYCSLKLLRLLLRIVRSDEMFDLTAKFLCSFFITFFTKCTPLT